MFSKAIEDSLFWSFSIESLSEEEDEDDKLSDSILFLLQSISGTCIKVSSIGLSGFSIFEGSRTVFVKSGRSESLVSGEIVKSIFSTIGDFSLLVGESIGDNLSSSLLQNVCMLALISGAGFKSFWQSVIVLRKDLNLESSVDALPDFCMLVLGLSPSKYFFLSSRDTLAAMPPVLCVRLRA